MSRTGYMVCPQGLGSSLILVIALKTELYMNCLLGPLPHCPKELVIVPVVLPVAQGATTHEQPSSSCLKKLCLCRA